MAATQALLVLAMTAKIARITLAMMKVCVANVIALIKAMNGILASAKQNIATRLAMLADVNLRF